MTQYSQHGEDVWIRQHWQELRLSPHAMYIDVGALDGVTHSNTLFLDEEGWLGLTFEPDPRVYTRLLENRVTNSDSSSRCQCFPILIGAEDLKAVPFNLAGEGLSTTGDHVLPVETIQVEQQTLQTAIQKAVSPSLRDRIEVLSIDTEGTEIDVLRGLWESPKIRAIYPKVLIVEHDTLNHPVKPVDKMREFVNYLMPRGYRWVHTTAGNMIFAR